MAELTHFDAAGASRMVDTSGKPETERIARASGCVRMNPATALLIRDRKLSKGDVLEVARLAGIMAAKRTGDLIPLCHPLPLTGVSVAALTVYDMCKAVDRVMTIERIRLEEKSGGKSGTFRRTD